MARKSKRPGTGTYLLHRVGKRTIYEPKVTDKDAAKARARIAFPAARPFSIWPVETFCAGKSRVYRMEGD